MGVKPDKQMRMMLASARRKLFQLPQICDRNKLQIKKKKKTWLAEGLGYTFAFVSVDLVITLRMNTWFKEQVSFPEGGVNVAKYLILPVVNSDVLEQCNYF